ncbi:MAG: ATP-binding protein [Chlamydiales bacterium]|nr:ATP-binding protein [Chlamydiales bacterium]
MYQRRLQKEVLELAQGLPVVTITGPRQSGKTTLVRHCFPNKPYINLESPDVRNAAIADPRGFFSRLPDGAILDEIQRAPELLSYIQVIVDEAKKKGMFILTGSQQIEVHEAISQSLAGRVGLLQLLPMSLGELSNAGFDLTIDQALVQGGYPRIFADQLNPTKVYRSYFETYIERDLRQVIQVKDLSLFQNFMMLCAGRIGQVVNFVSLSNDVGVSVNTIKQWLSILEASFVIIRLRPYFENFGKRLVKSPKLFFSDTGLAAFLLGIENAEQMRRDPLRGNLMENLVFLELYKARINQGLDPRLYYFRDSSGNEVDFIYQRARELIPIEVKAAQTYHSSFFKTLEYFKKVVKNRCPKGYVIYAGDVEQSIGDFELINYKKSELIISNGIEYL